MSRKSKYENDGVLFPRGNNSFGIPRKTWYIAKYLTSINGIVNEDNLDADLKKHEGSLDYKEFKKILDDLIMDLAQSCEDEFVVYDTYVDDGFSGTDFNRPSFQKLLRDMKDNYINMIVTKDLSRLGRNYIEVGNYIEQIFPLFNIRFVTKAEDIDSYSKPTSVNSILVPFKNLINDEYCRDISNKIILANNSRKKNGQYLGSFPIYRIYQRSTR